MAEEKPTNVRFRSDVLAKITLAAHRFGMTKSSIIKLATALFIDDFERRGAAALPRDWQEILENLDGRTLRYMPGGTGHRIKQVGSKNIGVVHAKNFTTAPDAPASGPVKGQKGKRGKKKPEK